MILVCPECAARYTVKEEAFRPAGRKVRCAKCGHSWHQGPPEDAPISEPGPEPASGPAPQPAPNPPPAPPPVATIPEPEQAPVRTARAAVVDESYYQAGASRDAEAEEAAPPVPARRSGRYAAAFGWGALVLAVVLIIGGAAGLRQQIAHAWPRSASFYTAIGLPVNASGIAFSAVRYTRQIEDSQTVLAVTGTLVNVTDGRQMVPQVRVILSGANGKELFRWQFRPAVRTLDAGQSAPFKTRLSSPPDGARHLTLEFVPPDEPGL